MAATCGSTSAGTRTMPSGHADTRRNWSRSHRTFSWPTAPSARRLCNMPPAPCRSCLRPSRIRSGPAWSKAWAHPGGNTTGFTIFEYGMSGKWLELLKEIAPRVRRAAVIRDPLLTSGTAQFGVIQSVAHSLEAELFPVGARDADEIERGLSTFAREPNGGVIVTA